MLGVESVPPKFALRGEEDDFSKEKQGVLFRREVCIMGGGNQQLQGVN